MYSLVVNLRVCVNCGNCTNIFRGKYSTLLSSGELLLDNLSNEDRELIELAVEKCYVEALLFKVIK